MNKPKYKVGQKIKTPKGIGTIVCISNAVPPYLIDLGNKFVGHNGGTCHHNGHPSLNNHGWFLSEAEIKPVKRGRPAKVTEPDFVRDFKKATKEVEKVKKTLSAKPKPEPKVLGYILEYPNACRTKQEIIDILSGLRNSDDYHVYAVTAEYKLVSTSELKEVRGGVTK